MIRLLYCWLLDSHSWRWLNAYHEPADIRCRVCGKRYR